MNREKRISFRVTQTEYEKILDHCKAHNITISDFIRTILNKELINYE